MARAGALAAHVRYLGRERAGHEGEAGTFFDRNEEAVDGAKRTKDWAEHRHHFRFIISPEHGDRIADLQDYVRDVMGRVCWSGPSVEGACCFDPLTERWLRKRRQAVAEAPPIGRGRFIECD